jgi:hypothetical protein
VVIHLDEAERFVLPWHDEWAHQTHRRSGNFRVRWIHATIRMDRDGEPRVTLTADGVRIRKDGQDSAVQQHGQPVSTDDLPAAVVDEIRATLSAQTLPVGDLP